MSEAFDCAPGTTIGANSGSSIALVPNPEKEGPSPMSESPTSEETTAETLARVRLEAGRLRHEAAKRQVLDEVAKLADDLATIRDAYSRLLATTGPLAEYTRGVEVDRLLPEHLGSSINRTREAIRAFAADLQVFGKRPFRRTAARRRAA